MKLFVNLIIKVLIFKSIGAEELARDHLTKIENKSDTTFGANEEPIPSESFDDTTTEFASLSTSTDEDRTTTQMDERKFCLEITLTTLLKYDFTTSKFIYFFKFTHYMKIFNYS